MRRMYGWILREFERQKYTSLEKLCQPYPFCLEFSIFLYWLSRSNLLKIMNYSTTKLLYSLITFQTLHTNLQTLHINLVNNVLSIYSNIRLGIISNCTISQQYGIMEYVIMWISMLNKESILYSYRFSYTSYTSQQHFVAEDSPIKLL